jgi:hypothetical protein
MLHVKAVCCFHNNVNEAARKASCRTLPCDWLHLPLIDLESARPSPIISHHLNFQIRLTALATPQHNENKHNTPQRLT